MIETKVVRKEKVRELRSWLEPDFLLYAQKSPHQTMAPEELLEFLESPEGDELIIVGMNRQYAGFLTFRVQPCDGEIWGTIGMILLKPEAQAEGALAVVNEQVSALLRSRGCQVMNYMTARKGFARLAPRLGLRSRIVEWMKEL